MRLKNKIAIITGSARGIGQATALKFAAEGAKVVVCDLDRKAVDEVVEKILASQGQAIGGTLNVTKMASVNALMKEVMEKFGRIDVLVNNAGIVDDGRLRNMSEEQFDRVIDVNLKGTYNCTRAVVDIMIAQNGGVILNASSVVGIYGNFGQTNYAASKFGVIGMAKTWARELGRNGIRVNAVCPGFVETTILKSIPQKVMQAMIDRVPLGRLAKPEEIANTYAFLASDEASYISGAVIEVGGGATI
ncbi:MAG: 3-oxoacyl-ACP reductase FabG [Burkholderiales bacterium]